MPGINLPTYEQFDEQNTLLDAQNTLLESIAANIEPAEIINDLTTGGTAVALSAEQGKILNTNKIETSAIVNGLTETNAGKVLDARQGKTLSDKIGNQTYTEDNYITDAESLTESVDKLDMAVKDNADLISTNTQFTDVDNVVYSWRFIKSAEGHMQLEYMEVI
jgi:hypothetical protein